MSGYHIHKKTPALEKSDAFASYPIRQPDIPNPKIMTHVMDQGYIQLDNLAPSANLLKSHAKTKRLCQKKSNSSIPNAGCMVLCSLATAGVTATRSTSVSTRSFSIIQRREVFVIGDCFPIV